ncbi:hypothetical protein THIOSC15_2930019 [uncultured Thiomicrorhabdus sp.]
MEKKTRQRLSHAEYHRATIFLMENAEHLSGQNIDTIANKIKAATNTKITTFTIERIIEDHKLPITIRKIHKKRAASIKDVERLAAALQVIKDELEIDLPKEIEETINRLAS